MQHRVPAIFALALALASTAMGGESNAWPLAVVRSDPDGTIHTESVGPLFGERLRPDGASVQVWRPVLLKETAPGLERNLLLYPFFQWERRPDYSRFTFFELVNAHRQTDAAGVESQGLDVWPFYFSRKTGDPETSYRALLPFRGDLKHRFGQDRLSWVAFPLHVESLKRGKRTTYTPWPLVRRIEGEGHTGFEFWPLFGDRQRPGDYRHRFWLWPLAFHHANNLSAPQPDVKTGVLPFYNHSSGPGYRSDDYLWPFFGVTHRTAPAAYDEHRYLWPLLVQGRGARYVNRWAPFYSHSISQGVDKRWTLWPLFRTAAWQADGVAQRRDQFLFFIYWSLEQRSLAHPSAAPASKVHFWPFYSAWDNGAGRRQFQFLSPLEVFLPDNEPVRQLYSPLFALYRFDRRGPDDVRWSLLWSAVTAHRTATSREFHLGPFFGTERTPAGQSVTLGNGLIRWQKPAGGGHWRFSVFDFRDSTGNLSTGTASP